MGGMLEWTAPAYHHIVHVSSNSSNLEELRLCSSFLLSTTPPSKKPIEIIRPSSAQRGGALFALDSVQHTQQRTSHHVICESSGVIPYVSIKLLMPVYVLSSCPPSNLAGM